MPYVSVYEMHECAQPCAARTHALHKLNNGNSSELRLFRSVIACRPYICEC